jgi:hypothetical protein
MTLRDCSTTEAPATARGLNPATRVWIGEQRPGCSRGPAGHETRNKDALAMQIKLSELLTVARDSVDEVIAVEDLSEEELRTRGSHFNSAAGIFNSAAGIFAHHLAGP